MKSKIIFAPLVSIVLSACGSITLPAAVKMNDGQALIGTATAAVSGGTFQVATPKGDVTCSGNYDALDTRPVISAPVRCSDGRYGTITILRAPDGMSGNGSVMLADGTQGSVAFGGEAASVLSVPAAFPPAPSPTPTLVSADPSPTGLYDAASTTPSYPMGSAGRIYTGNCPTPESLDAAGHRCGARSAASRPGGYDGYSAWAKPSYSGGGSVHVNGYLRKNGTYVRGYTRRR
ncbi:hypothetical protein [Rhizobium leguminosarum]|uniref:hypothetical protein n=1 Tax=Rhizobium leguminosarum TaxID=384 RepID=UPI0010327393|nr:hypothetical protein [Rhizobium leguminosarum]TAV44985.1 hypothetical protein ELI29_29970 [Rhizobium leguminosarum]